MASYQHPMSLIMKITTITVDSAILWQDRSVTLDKNPPRIFNFQVICGSGTWPTPYEVGIYIDAENRQSCIIDWPLPCKPVWFSCDYGDFLVYLDTATEEEIVAAKKVTADFFRAD